MKYAAEVIDLLAAYPGREFRMVHIVRHIANGHPSSPKERERIRKGVRRVLESLEESDQVACSHSSSGQGGFALYRWKVGHDVLPKWDAKRDNIGRTIAP